MDNLSQYVRAVDLALTEYARGDKKLTGMGTTLTVAYTVGADLFTLHVGDSRAYLYRQGRLTQLTRDHTVAQSLADAGDIQPEEVATHKHRHVLTSALGGNAGLVRADIERARLQDGDRLLLCTDGLTDLVADDRIAHALEEAESPQHACNRLIELALAEGGRDNVTAVVARYTIPETPS
jgi:protein phosphatase